MTLIYLLLALLAERLISKPDNCHGNFYLDRYISWLESKHYLNTTTTTVYLIVWLYVRYNKRKNEECQYN